MQFFKKIYWPTWLAGYAIAGLVAMLLVEHLADLPPCPLCYQQRQIYLAIAIFGIVASLLLGTKNDNLTRTILNGVLAILFAGSFVAASYHAGVEWKWWLGPAECSAGADIGAILNEEIDFSNTINVVSCSDAPWRFAGLSFAGWNAVASIAFAIASIKVVLTQIRTYK